MCSGRISAEQEEEKMKNISQREMKGKQHKKRERESKTIYHNNW